MRIGYCFSNLLMGGAQTLIANLANEFKNKHEVRYCVLSMDKADQLMIDMLKDVKKVSPEELLEWSDVIHMDFTDVKGQRKAFKKKWKQTVQMVGSTETKMNFFNKHLYAHNLIAVSKAVQKILKKKNILINQGVDINKFKPLNIEKRYDIVFLGRLRPIKNPELFLEIAKKGNFSFLIIGGTHNREGGRINETERKAREQAREGMDYVTGFISHYEVPKFLNQARISVVTSNSEALGFNCLESMACGVPVVGRRVGGVPEAVGENSDLLVPYGASAEVYVEKIKKYLNDKELPGKVRRRIIDKFSFENEVKEVLNIYKKIYNDL